MHPTGGRGGGGEAGKSLVRMSCAVQSLSSYSRQCVQYQGPWHTIASCLRAPGSVRVCVGEGAGGGGGGGEWRGGGDVTYQDHAHWKHMPGNTLLGVRHLSIYGK